MTDELAPRVTVAIVHYRSGGMLLDVLDDLLAQDGVTLDIHVVESGTDGTVENAQRTHPQLTVHRPGRNVGYAGGNNIVMSETSGSPLLVVNPDVRMPDRGTVRGLLDVLTSSQQAAAVAPVIMLDDDTIEYAGSIVDRTTAEAVHTHTHVSRWPWPGPVHEIAWLDGACLLFAREAIEEVGLFDERFFLIVEEVDWCVRASDQGWRLLLTESHRVGHQRSSSFGGSTKSAYYHARNTYLLGTNHLHGHGWKLHWAGRVLRANLRRSALGSGAARSAARGAVDAVRGRWGPAPEDRG